MAFTWALPEMMSGIHALAAPPQNPGVWDMTLLGSIMTTCSTLSFGSSDVLFTAGLMVMEKNWLEVYPWFKWGGNDNLPPFQVNQTFMPTELLLKEVGLSP